MRTCIFFYIFMYVTFSTWFLHHKLTWKHYQETMSLKLENYTAISCVCISLHITPNMKSKLMDGIFIFC